MHFNFKFIWIETRILVRANTNKIQKSRNNVKKCNFTSRYYSTKWRIFLHLYVTCITFLSHKKKDNPQNLLLPPKKELKLHSYLFLIFFKLTFTFDWYILVCIFRYFLCKGLFSCSRTGVPSWITLTLCHIEWKHPQGQTGETTV